MADRAMMYCPVCDRQNPGNPTNAELVRDNDRYSCMFGHQIHGYENLMTLQPRLIPLEFRERAGVNDVKTEFWVNRDVLQQFREKYPNQQNTTVSHILQLYLTGDVVIIDGKQATELKKFGVRNGADILGLVQASKALEAEKDEIAKELKILQNLFKRAMGESSEE